MKDNSPLQLLLKHWHKTDLDSQLDDYENKAYTIQRGVFLIYSIVIHVCVLQLDLLLTAFRKHSTRKRSLKNDKEKVAIQIICLDCMHSSSSTVSSSWCMSWMYFSL